MLGWLCRSVPVVEILLWQLWSVTHRCLADMQVCHWSISSAPSLSIYDQLVLRQFDAAA